MALDINELVRWEREELHEVPSLWARALDFLSIGPGLSVRRDAKVNMLKFLQTETVKQYELAYDNLYFELGGGLECLRQIDSFAPLEDSGLFQKELDMQSLGADAKQEKQLQAYLADASAATCRLHDLVREIEKDVDGCVGKYPVVKRLDRTKCKADKSCGGDVRKVTDMARVAVVCDKPEDLVQAYRTLMERLKPERVLRVSNGFNSGWMPSGYRDVKLNPVVGDHVCEIQLHLLAFHDLKAGQHEVYEWVRDLKVTTSTEPEYLFKGLSRQVTEEMIHLAERNWHGTRNCLPQLYYNTGQYDQARDGYKKRVSEIEDEVLGVEDNSGSEWRRLLLAEAQTKNNLSLILELQGEYSQAKQLYERTQEIFEFSLGQGHPSRAAIMLNRAGLMTRQGKYTDAGALIDSACAILEATLKKKHPRFAVALNNRAELLRTQGKYHAAETYHEKACAIREESLGVHHPDVGVSFNNLATVLENQGKYEDAMLRYERAQEIQEQALGPGHPEVASTLNNRASLLQTMGRYAEAEAVYKRSQTIQERSLGAEHPGVAQSLNNRADLLETQGKYTEARLLFKRSLAIREKALGRRHPDVAQSLNNLAGLLQTEGHYSRAEGLYKRALAIDEAAFGPDHPRVATDLNNLALCLEEQAHSLESQDYVEAGRLLKRSLAIREHTLGPIHPDVAVSLNNQAGLLVRQEKYEEARPLYERSLAIDTTVFGPVHPTIALDLNNWAKLLANQDKPSEAEPFLKRAQEIFENCFGEDHPDVATVIVNRAEALIRQEKDEQAIPLLEKGLSIRTAALGGTHKATVQTETLLNQSREIVSLIEGNQVLDNHNLAMDELFARRADLQRAEQRDGLHATGAGRDEVGDTPRNLSNLSQDVKRLAEYSQKMEGLTKELQELLNLVDRDNESTNRTNRIRRLHMLIENAIEVDREQAAQTE